MKFYSNSKMLVNSLDPKLLSKKVTFSEKEVLSEKVFCQKFANSYSSIDILQAQQK
jgi:hypothetical protein